MIITNLRQTFRLLAAMGTCSLLFSVQIPAAGYDVVVYGATAGGVITAVSAAREGLKVALLEPRDHLGGMVSGGLSYTDYGRKEVIGGYALEFFWRVGNRYSLRRFGQDASWYFEPHVAEQVFREMLDDAGVNVLVRHRLREKTGVMKAGGRIIKISTENGASFTSRIFADCSYEGDLMAQAGVSYTWGREGVSQYGESLAGVRERTPYHQFTVNISPYDADGKLLPEVSPGPAGEVGAGDKKVQAYNFRLCLSSDKNNQIPFPKPAGYTPRRYELMARMLRAMTEKLGRAPRLDEVCKPDSIPNKKADVNNNGAFSTDFIGRNWGYPEGDYKTRQRIWQEHIDYIAGFFYFLANDPSVPRALQEETRQWGLAKDEFTDTGNWPHQLYIREARRMVGEYVVTQKDLQTDLTKPDPIGMGSYNSDSHNIQRIPTGDGFVVNEGDMQVPVTPYQIPFRIMLPRKNEVQNLLVPVCFSASHVAYSSLRMEPQYMIIGQAAGVAAKMAIDAAVPVQDVDTIELTQRLREQGAVMEYKPGPPRPTYKRFKQVVE
ncbi:MAG TPA: FAD-dependent oxidoreductase [Acidobacteriota bacterium]|nr:FAD-dependent oxidoreductase [Acidobacteriota bacterium]